MNKLAFQAMLLSALLGAVTFGSAAFIWQTVVTKDDEIKIDDAVMQCEFERIAGPPFLITKHELDRTSRLITARRSGRTYMFPRGQLKTCIDTQEAGS